MPVLRTCIEGCGNILTATDHRRFPESLSRPLPLAQQSVGRNDIARLNMRLRCSLCYGSRYKKQFFAISYRWSVEDRNDSFATVTIHDESTGIITPGVRIPVRNQSQRSIIMSCRLFFLDVLNASSGSGQWVPTNLIETYTSCKGIKILLNASDHELLNGSRKTPLHQSTLTRDRDGYLRALYGKQERASAYMRLPPDDIRFYSMYGRDMGNIEVEGLVKGDDNVYQTMRKYWSHLMFGSGNTRPAGSAIAKMFPTPPHKRKKKEPSQREILAFEQNPEAIFDANGHLALPTTAHVMPGSMPADLGLVTAFGHPLLPAMSEIGTSPIPSSYHPDLSTEYDSILLPCMNLDPTTSMAASNLGASSYMSHSSFNVACDPSMASITNNMADMNLYFESEHSFDPHSDYMNQLQSPGQM